MGGVTRLLLLLWAGVTVSTVVDLQKRIIGGQTCGQNKRPYHVKLTITDGTHEFFCGGSLINDRWILTAEHCQEPRWTIYANLSVHPGSGYKVVTIAAEPETYTDNNHIRHDIMLLKLPNPTQIEHVPLPDCDNRNNRPRIGDAVQIAGHGADITGPDNERVDGETDTLQCANTTVVDCQRLRDLKYFEAPHRLHQHWFCGQRARVDACPGDSGGGVVYNGKIYGVISFTGDWDYACKEAIGFMDVCAYIQWIRNTTNRP